MFTNADIKSRAKDALRPNYIYALLAILIPGIAGALLSYISGISAAIVSYATVIFYTIAPYGAPSVLQVIAFILNTMAITLINMFTAVALAPLEVGIARYFINSSRGKSDFTDVFSGFTDGHILNYYRVLFMVKLKILLYTLLFIIPGIIKTYEYFFANHVLAENPEFTPTQVMQKSKSLTDNVKLKIFGLQFSFFGYLVLAAILDEILPGFPVSFELFLQPYIVMSYAVLYLHLSSPPKYGPPLNQNMNPQF